eukprot:TRINITY_DN60221_c0_g1_i1.p1 TRINITY_DN60221_c0_g1~~TRINITY_DN60221_c0_g1_i1.p1  ORF type:complete len:181 (-),score=42.05 TRINITY_DN60221_c0_g1_i1:92-634(-)
MAAIEARQPPQDWRAPENHPSWRVVHNQPTDWAPSGRAEGSVQWHSIRREDREEARQAEEDEVPPSHLDEITKRVLESSELAASKQELEEGWRDRKADVQARFNVDADDGHRSKLVEWARDRGVVTSASWFGASRSQAGQDLSLIHISEPTRLLSISYAVFCLKKKKRKSKIRWVVTTMK